MVHIVGAGSGAPDLITLRGAELLRKAQVVIYAGSLVNPSLLGLCGPDCRLYNSAHLTLEEVLEVIRQATEQNQDVVRLHTGDPCLFGAIREQTDALDALGIGWDVTPGVSSFCGAAAALGAEYTLPGVSQSLIITRLAGRTPVPEREQLAAMASHGASMAIFLSSGMLPEVASQLHRRYPRRSGLQGHLAGRAHLPLHHRHTGPKRRRGRHSQHRAGTGGRVSAAGQRPL